MADYKSYFTKENIGQAMREARIREELTRVGLSELSGISANSIRNYEHGTALPGLYNLLCLADVLGMSLDEYIGRKVK